MIFYTIYKITNLLDNRIYIGYHSTKDINDKYFGSSKSLTNDIKKFGKSNFKKEILFVFYDRKIALKKEEEIVNKEFVFREDTYNKHTGGIDTCFLYEGMVTVKNKKGDFLKVYLDDPRYLSGELIHNTKGTVTTKDNKGNFVQMDLSDSRYILREVFHCRKGEIHSEETKSKISNSHKGKKISKQHCDKIHNGLKLYLSKNKDSFIAKDKEGNCFRVSKNDSRILNGEIFGVSKGLVTVKDKNGVTTKVKKEDSRYLSGELVHISTGFICKKLAKPVIKYDLFNNIIEEYPSIGNAEKYNKTGISACVRGKQKTSNGFIWKYKN